jgi:hypothetical protein
MNGELMSESGGKAVCSVSELAQALGLSRARFYQLVRLGFFPSPIYDLRTKRPYYPQELQQICHEVRRTNIGHNGLPILFYGSRQKDVPSPPNSPYSATKPKVPPLNPLYRELAGALGNMGLQGISPEQVQEAVRTLHLEAKIHDLDSGILIRELYRHLKPRGSI